MNWKPEKIFLFLSPVFGLFYFLFTPPFQGPDEINHFRRAYQVSCGEFVSVRYGQRLGGFFPEEIAYAADSFTYLRWQPHRKTGLWRIREGMNTVSREKPVFADLPNAAQYAPLPYLPAAIGIFLGKLFHAPPLVLMYAGRFFNLLFWIFFGYLTLRTIPVIRRTMLLFLLVPMLSFINVMNSADVVTNSLCFFSFAFLLKHALGEAAIDKKAMLIFIILFVALMLCKTVYTPVFVLFFLIRISRFGSLRNYLLTLTGMIILGAGSLALWGVVMSDRYVPATEYDFTYFDHSALGENSNAAVQWEHFKADPSRIFSLLTDSLSPALENGFESLTGVMGWLDVHFPEWLHWCMLLSLILVALCEPKNNFRFSWKLFLAALIGFVISYILIIFSQYITWSSVSEYQTVWIQGRYILPVFPMLLLLIAFFPRKSLRWPALMIPAFMVCIHSLCLQILYRRYYSIPIFEDRLITCDAEHVQEDRLPTSHPGIFLSGVPARSNMVARSGAYSLLLGGPEQFGFTFKTTEVGKNDMLYCKVFRKGEKGAIVIDAQEAEVYQWQEAAPEGKNGWQQIRLDHIFTQSNKGSETKIYIYNPNTDKSYFDDFSVLHRKVIGYK